MIIELPKEYKYEAKNGRKRYIDNYIDIKSGVLHIYGDIYFRELMYSLTYALKGRNICYYCGDRIKENHSTLDHIYPQDMGGPTITNNLVPCCEKCNNEKANLSEAEYEMFKKSSPEYRKTLREIIANKHEETRKNARYGIPNEWVTYRIAGEFVVMVDLSSMGYKEKKYSYKKRYLKEYNTIPKPVITDKNGVVLDGYIGLMVAKEMGLKNIPTITLENVIVHL